MASFFFNGLGLSLGAKLVSTNGRPSYSSIIFRLFPSEGEKKNGVAFCTNRLEVLQGMSVEFFAKEVEDLTCLCSFSIIYEKNGSYTKTK